MYIYRILLASNGYKVPPIYQTVNWFIIFCLKYYYTRQVVIYVYDKSFHLTSKLCITLLQTRLWRTRCNSLVIRHSRLPSENKAFNMFGSTAVVHAYSYGFVYQSEWHPPFSNNYLSGLYWNIRKWGTNCTTTSLQFKISWDFLLF